MRSMSNRVEDLESRVEELEATVRGLTEELVESNERIRELEADDEAASVEPREIGVETDRSEEKEQVDDAVGDIIVA
jgi:predicted  nucleic acid-binding Zn-ribbon protein